jgi:hypothetical protein
VLLCCAVLLACLMAVASPAVASSSTTTVSGTVPLIAYQVAASDITCSGAVISWQTNGPSTSQVFYDTVWHGNVADYAHHVESDSLVLIHSLSLSGLSSGTSYYFAVKSVLTDNGNSLTAVEDNFFFTALAPGTAITISSPPNGKLPGGEVGVAYSQPLVAFGGTPAYRWCIVGGRLPCGLLLNASTGVISGTPAKAGTFKFTVQVKDKAGATATEALSIKIIAGPHICSSSPSNIGGETVAALVASSTAGLALISAAISGW